MSQLLGRLAAVKEILVRKLNGDQEVTSFDTSFWREGSGWAIPSNSALYVLAANQLVMHYWSHNVACSQTGSFFGRDDQGGCTITTYGEDELTRWFGAPSANKGVMPTFTQYTAYNHLTGAWTFSQAGVTINNPAATFAYTFQSAAIAANRTITLPLLTANDTMAVLGFAQTFSATQTFAGINATSIGATTAGTGKFTGITMNAAANTIAPGTTGGIVGTTLADSAQAGSVGEYLTATIATPGTTLTTGTPVNVITAGLSLTAGDWDVWADVCLLPGATTSITQFAWGLSSTTGTLPAAGSGLGQWIEPATVPGAATPLCEIVCPIRVNQSGTAAVFLVASATFTISSLSAFGTIRARRVR